MSDNEEPHLRLVVVVGGTMMTMRVPRGAWVNDDVEVVGGEGSSAFLMSSLEAAFRESRAQQQTREAAAEAEKDEKRKKRKVVHLTPEEADDMQGKLAGTPGAVCCAAGCGRVMDPATAAYIVSEDKGCTHAVCKDDVTECDAANKVDACPVCRREIMYTCVRSDEAAKGTDSDAAGGEKDSSSSSRGTKRSRGGGAC